MLKVLIADDEQLICSMINKMIDWEGRGLALAGMANNGLDVLDQIRELHPDIVITDIRMPGLTGLELIEEAMKIDESLDFIIISGYKNFDYAHQALTMGVRHYLLKPIDRTELMETLDRIIEERRKTDANRRENEAFAEQQESYRQEARQHFLNSILQDSGMETADGAAQDTGSEEERLAFHGEGYRAFFVKLDSTDEGEIEPGLLEILRTLVEKEETDQWHCEHITTLVKSGIISVINAPAGARQAHPKDMETLFTKCRRETDKFTGYSVTIGVGAEKDQIQDTRISIDEATRAVKYRIRSGLARVIHYEDLKRVDEDISSVFTQDHRNGNRRAVESLDAAAVQDDTQILYEQLARRSDYSPLKLFCLIETFAQIIRETWEENAVEEQIISEFTYAVEELMDRSTTEARLIQRFQDAIEYYFRKVLEQRRQNGSASIREAKQYLAEHYRENPSLEEVADRVGMSPTYLSAMFKKEVGIGFSDYLIQLRCEESKRLIRTTQEPLAAVAEAVGYQDPKYFSRIFRKTVGIKPSEYRKLYQ